jgi:flagellar assembly protein FliH
MFLPDLLGKRDKLSLALASDAARLAHALVRRALPEFNRRYGPLEIETVVSQAIQTAIDQPRIHVRVAPDIAERITAPVQSAAETAGYAGRVTVVGDPALGPADVKVEWSDGGVERMAEQVWANLTAIVARLVEGLEADTGLKSVTVDSAA